MISTNQQLPLHRLDTVEVFEGSGIANLDARAARLAPLTFSDGFDAGFTWGITIAVITFAIISLF